MGDGAVQDVRTAGPCPGDHAPDAREFAEAWKRADSKAVQEVMRRQLAWEARQTPGVDPPSDKDGSAPS